MLPAMKQKKKVSLIFISVLLLCTIVVFSLFSYFSVGKQNGTARVVNYTGIVRGATQRLVKQELNGHPNDPLIDQLDDIIENLQTGQGPYDLIQLQDQSFQLQLEQLKEQWRDLKAEIRKVRQGSGEEGLYELSENYFALADQTVSTAEIYAENSLQTSRTWFLILNFTMLVLIILFWSLNVRQKKMSRELELAELASNEKSAFLSKMSHEIRTPMNGIIGMTEIAKLSVSDEKKVSECLDKIDFSSKYLLSLINDVLDMSRIESGKMEIEETEFDLSALVEGIRTMFNAKAQAEGIEFLVTSDIDDIKIVIGDDLRMNQVLLNVISNAMKFTPEGGSVSLHCACSKIDDAQALVRFIIRDTGIGMSEEFMAHMFEPFEQAKNISNKQYKGTGLGLPISHNLVQMMHGEIKVDSTEGKGTVFDITLPLGISSKSELPNQRSVSEADMDTYHFVGKRILIAEDNEINAEIVKKMLEYTGADIEHVWNGKEAVEVFRNAAEGYFDLILMDMQMPEMNGGEAVRIIRQQSRKDAGLPIIALTANAFNSDMEQALAGGMDDYLTKPIEMKKLYSTIGSWLQRSK